MYATTMMIGFTILSGPGNKEECGENLEDSRISIQQGNALGGRHLWRSWLILLTGL
jgi:hypothetical protein